MKKLYSTKSTLLTGTLFLTLAGILTRIIGFFYRIFLSRTIGAEGLGIYQLIAPVTAICFAFTAAGIQTSISKFVSMEVGRKNDAGAKTYLSIGLFISLCLSTLCSLFQTIIITVDTGMDTAWDKGKGEHSKERRAPLITKPGNSNKIRIMIEKKAAECGKA